MKTYSAKPSDVTRQWYVIDASEAPLGRLATHIAQLLTGKGKPQFTKHIDCGDYVIVINAENTVATGDKVNKKVYSDFDVTEFSEKPARIKAKIRGIPVKGKNIDIKAVTYHNLEIKKVGGYWEAIVVLDI